MRKSADTLLQAMGIFQATAMRSSASRPGHRDAVSADPRRRSSRRSRLTNLGSDLLIPSQRSALEPNHRETEFRVDELSAPWRRGRLSRMSRTFTPPDWSHHGSQPKQTDNH